jgi:molybdenum cofactor cytidylyltransferase
MGTLRLSAVVLAAGSSTRMAGKHKLLLPLGGEPVIRRTVHAALAAGPEETVALCVTGCVFGKETAAAQGNPMNCPTH